MAKLKLSVPKDLKKKMKKFSEVNWSELVRKVVEEKTQELVWKEDMTKKAKEEEELTKWAVKLQKESREGRFEELKKKGLV